jgi:hypothetical protein
MATLTFSFDTGAVPLSRIIDAFAKAYKYEAIINGAPNPETKAQFARRMVQLYIRDVVVSTERNVAVAAIAPTELELT